MQLAIVLLAAFSLSSLVLADEPTSFLAVQRRCYGWWCRYKELNIVSVNSATGAVTELANLVQAGTAAEIDRLVSHAVYDPIEGDYYVLISDSFFLDNYLHRYKISDNSLSQILLPYVFNAQNLTTLQFDFSSRMVLATFENWLTLVNMLDGSFKGLWQLWNPKDYQSTKVSGYDSINHMYYVVVSGTSQQKARCYYLVSTNVVSKDISISPCFPNPGDPNSPDLFAFISIFGYAEGKILAIVRNILGISVNIVDIYLGNQTTLFSAYEFSEENWTLPGRLSTNDYDPKNEEILMLVQDRSSANYRTASVLLDPMLAATGASLTSGDTLSHFKIYR